MMIGDHRCPLNTFNVNLCTTINNKGFVYNLKLKNFSKVLKNYFKAT